LTDISTPISYLTTAMQQLQWAREDSFFVANGHVFWGKRNEGSFSLYGSKCVAQNAADPEGLAAVLNAAIAEERERRLAKCEAAVKAARQAVLDAVA
jgi:hypothetical protein